MKRRRSTPRWCFYSKNRRKNRNKGHRRRTIIAHTTQRLQHSVFTSVLNVDERSTRMREAGMYSFDTDSSTIVCNNSANVSICKDKRMFVGEMRHIANTQVVTIGGKGHQASGIGTVRWIWSDDYGKNHEYLIEDALYFPQSPINILSVTAFAKQLNDTEGTSIDTK